MPACLRHELQIGLLWDTEMGGGMTIPVAGIVAAVYVSVSSHIALAINSARGCNASWPSYPRL